MDATPRYDVLPAGLSAERFTSALKEFRQVLGAEHVIAEHERLLPYLKLMVPVDAAAHAPSAVVLPGSLDELQRLLAVCNRHGVPVWPVSTGRNFGYGSASPATRGQVVLDLKRLNRIIEVDAELGTALVEPGVTYQQLQDYLQERKIPLWLDFPAPGPLVSPVGNTLERGGGLTPYGDHFANSCGMEVMLADGTLLRTGLGEVPDTRSWQVSKYGVGPYLDGLFTQSNFGIVTKLGLWLMPAPPAYRTVLVQWDRDADVARAVEAIRPLRLDGTIPNFGVLFNATLALTSFATRAQVYTGPGAIPEDVALKAAQGFHIAAWNYLFTLYGRPEQIAPDADIVKRELEAAGGRVIFDVHDPMQSNELGLQSFKLLNWAGGGGLAWFSPVCPTRGVDMLRQNEIARRIMGQHGLDFMTGATVNGREMLNVMPIVYNRADAAQTQAVKACFHALIAAFSQAGYGLYRTGIGFMDEATTLNSPTSVAVNRRIKQALDPNGILAPGKSGIHPLPRRAGGRA
jgi:4-cresol dehydrogenase (hydroxylating) flavoprotein subunit